MERSYPFLKFKWVALGISTSLFLFFLAGTIINGGFNMGVDFVGGIKIITSFDKGVDEGSIRSALKEFSPSVQRIGSDEKNNFIISTKAIAGKVSSADITEKIKSILTAKYKNVVFLSVENVGPAIGDFLKKSAGKLILISLILMSVYLSFRFEIKYAAGAMVALVHDIAISLVFCGFAGVEMNVPVIAAFLTIFGYSVNDTIIIFDRIRENVNTQTKISYPDLINKSINQTLTRSILTSLTTLFAVIALYVLGGEGLNDFALVLLIGIFVGTYSTLYVASPTLLIWDRVFKKK